LTRESRDLGARRFLLLVVAVAVPFTLWEGRGTTFDNDELALFERTDGYDPDTLLRPHNGHLILLPRLVYQMVFDITGPEYVLLRAIGVVGVVLCAIALFALARVRLDPWLALAPAALVLFLGSAWTVILTPFDAFVWAYPIAAGLGALLALQGGSAAGNVAACVGLALAVACGSVGLVFLVGAAVAVLMRDDRWRSAWVVLVPLALYAAWWVWALRFDESQIDLANVLVVPNFLANSLAAAIAALAGLDSDLTAPLHVEPEWGRPLAIIAVAALILRFRRGSIPTLLWVSLSIAISFWALAALAFGPGRTPEETRYLFVGGIGVLLIAIAALEGVPIRRGAVLGVAAGTALAVLGNLYQLDAAASNIRQGYARTVRSQLAMIELARERVPADFSPATDTPDVSPPVLISRAGPYLDAVDRFGSPAFSVEEVAEQSEEVRRGADVVLARALGVRVRPVTIAGDTREGCRRIAPAEHPGGFQLSAGGVLVRATGQAAELKLRRFADTFALTLGTLGSGESARIRIPVDPAPAPWWISGSASLTVCGLDLRG
jgi:hypothetical protein